MSCGLIESQDQSHSGDSTVFGPSASEKLLELIDRQARVANDATHRLGIDRIVPWNRHESNTIAHDRVLGTGTHDAETGLLQRPDGLQVVDARQLGHRSDGDFDFSDLVLLQRLLNSCEILPDGILNVLERLLLGRPLRPASGKAWTRHAETLIALLQNNLVPHTHDFTPCPAGSLAGRRLQF